MHRMNPLALLRRLLRTVTDRPPARKGPRPPTKQRPPAGAIVRRPPRPANNTTCDVYRSTGVPPATPDVAAVSCALIPAFREGSEASEGDQDFRYTHVLYCDPEVDIRDSYPAAPAADTIYVPDRTGTGFQVVFVELVNRGQPNGYLRVYLDRKAPTWPTSEL